MSDGTTEPTGRRSRAGRRAVVVVLLVVVLLAVLTVVAESVLRGVVDRTIARQVEQALPEGTTGTVHAHADGVVIPQLVAGRLDRVDISTRRITVQGIPLAADVTVHDVPVDGQGSVRDVRGDVTLAAASVKDLSTYSPLFDRLSLVDGGVELAGTTAVLGYDIDYAARGTVVAQDGGRGITITPERVRITNDALGVDVDDIPGVLGTHVQVCTARFLPEQVRVDRLSLTRERARVHVSADELPLSERGLRTTGTC